MNWERAQYWREHREQTRVIRESVGWIAKGLHLPQFERAHVTALIDVTHPVADTGNHYGAIKAMIDGLVDCGTLPDDSGEHVLSITMMAPRQVTQRVEEGITLVLSDHNAPAALVCRKCGTWAHEWRFDQHGGVCRCGQLHGGADAVKSLTQVRGSGHSPKPIGDA